MLLLSKIWETRKIQKNLFFQSTAFFTWFDFLARVESLDPCERSPNVGVPRVARSEPGHFPVAWHARCIHAYVSSIWMTVDCRAPSHKYQKDWEEQTTHFQRSFSFSFSVSGHSDRGGWKWEDNTTSIIISAGTFLFVQLVKRTRNAIFFFPRQSYHISSNIARKGVDRGVVRYISTLRKNRGKLVYFWTAYIPYTFSYYKNFTFFKQFLDENDESECWMLPMSITIIIIIDVIQNLGISCL